jgi:phosphoribosylanthranilate isomerase
MWIKICANTNLADAALATELGADAVGFVFAPSPRQVTVAQVAAITPHLPQNIERIGVFYTLDPAEIIAAVRQAHLTGVQLHGGYSASLVTALNAEFPAGLRIIQTNHWRIGAQNANTFASELSTLSLIPAIDAVLVDSRTAAASGGTGVPFDWQAARSAMISLGTKPLILAGGLTPANVAEAITTLHPFGVDVASGVESHPGQKDPTRLKAFIAAARASTALA